MMRCLSRVGHRCSRDQVSTSLRHIGKRCSLFVISVGLELHEPDRLLSDEVRPCARHPPYVARYERVMSHHRAILGVAAAGDFRSQVSASSRRGGCGV